MEFGAANANKTGRLAFLALIFDSNVSHQCARWSTSSVETYSYLPPGIAVVTVMQWRSAAIREGDSPGMSCRSMFDRERPAVAALLPRPAYHEPKREPTRQNFNWNTT
jgi:hypothetical protein